MHRWKGPEAEGGGEEPVVNQNRRSTESPSHLSETVRGLVYVGIVARAISPVTVRNRSIGVNFTAVPIIVLYTIARTSIAAMMRVVASEDGKN